MPQNKRIVFVGNSQQDMVKCRGHVMARLAQLGYEIHLIAPQDISLKQASLPFTISWHKWFLKSQSHNPFTEIFSFFHLLKLLMMIRPHIGFSYTVKANLYCAIIGKIIGFKTCSILTGLGRIFTIPFPFYQFAKRFILWGWQLSTQVWVMNDFDRRYLKFTNQDISLGHLPGEGVDITHFTSREKRKSSRTTHFLFIGRLLKSKGCEELFQAVNCLWQKGYPIHLKIAGIYDPRDQDKIENTQLEELIQRGCTEHFGYVEDIRSLIHQSHCLVLPSYREGLPRVLLEANAMQCPVITTKVPGCQDIVKDGVNGFLCIPRCSESLEKALLRFIELSEEERQKMGMSGQKIILQTYTTTHVQDFYLKTLQGIEK